jgi:hypothetical protein
MIRIENGYGRAYVVNAYIQAAPPVAVEQKRIHASIKQCIKTHP